MKGIDGSESACDSVNQTCRITFLILPAPGVIWRNNARYNQPGKGNVYLTCMMTITANSSTRSRQKHFLEEKNGKKKQSKYNIRVTFRSQHL